MNKQILAFVLLGIFAYPIANFLIAVAAVRGHSGIYVLLMVVLITAINGILLDASEEEDAIELFFVSSLTIILTTITLVFFAELFLLLLM